MASGSAAGSTLGTPSDSRRAVPDVISQVMRVVWPEAQRVVLTRAPSPMRGGRHDYVALPSLRHPRWLLPTTVAVPAESLVAPGSGIGKRLGLAGLSAILRVGLGPWLPMRKVRVDVGGEPSLLHLLGELVGEQDLTLAIRLGHWQLPRAVVLRMLSPTGTTLGFAKLSLDALGRDSVQAEASGLAKAESLHLSQIEAPAVWHHGRWQDQELLVTRPLLVGSGTDALQSMPVEAMAELTRAGNARVDSLTASAWYAAAVRRVEAVNDQATRRRFESVLDEINAAERRTGTRLLLSCWHGDWTPWNMARCDSRVLLWDWEHAADDVPVGFDHIHFLAQRMRVASGTDTQSEQRWLQEATDVLRGVVGLDERQLILLIVAYLLDVNVRYVLDRQATSQDHESRTGWGLDLLEGQARRLRPQSEEE
jgi:hypothetical protein